MSGPEPRAAADLTACPDEATLHHFLEAEPAAEAEVSTRTLARHVRDCPACLDRLDRWSRDPDLRSWFGADGDPTSIRDVEFGAILEQADALGVLGARPPSPSAPRVPAVPDRLGPYRIVRCAGRGGTGTVYEAFDPRLGRRVALKRLHSDLESGPGVLDRFQREAQVLAALNHPHIVPVYEVAESEGQPYLVLEYLAGGTLALWAAGRAIAPTEAAGAVATLARAVQYAHEQGVIHRDLKPGNVLLKLRDGHSGDPPDALRGSLSPWQLMIGDFGLARWLRSDSDLTHTGQPIGTPAYMAPEQATGPSTGVGPAVDTYALGVILYELLTGRRPFQAATQVGTLQLIQHAEPLAPRLIQPGVSADLETITLKCLEKDPRRRYATAGALADDLERFLTHRAILARPVGWPGRASRWCRRNPLVAGLTALALGLLVALALGSLGYALDQARLRRQADQYRTQAESNARAASRAQQATGQHLREAIGAILQVADRLEVGGPAPDPGIVALRNDSLNSAERWCAEYLARFPSSDQWTFEDLRLAVIRAGILTLLDRPEALTFADQCLAAAQRLERRYPGSLLPEDQALQFEIRALRAEIYRRRNQHAAAILDLETVLAQATDPLQRLALRYKRLESRSLVGPIGELRAEAEALADAPLPDSREARGLVMSLAVLLARLANEPDLRDADRDRLAARSVALLGAVWNWRILDPRVFGSMLSCEPAFTPLRDRDDFQTLVRTVTP